MPEVDPLVLKIIVDDRDYKAKLRASTALVTDSLGRQEKTARNLERQMQRSSGAISGSLKGIAASLAGAFSVQQIGGLIDNFTRLQNSLRVAGLEGEGLADVQAKLLDLSGRYGVSINELADLYGKSSQAASDLGASEAQLLQITEASAQALKITGTSATQAQGALLGLTQALSSGIVRAEEFNQINEGGLRPLLQVAANTEKYGGSVAKLRAAVIDGKVSSQEFYQAILNGSKVLEGQASKATLTLSGAFAALTSNLTVYVGEASAANGVTSALAAAIGFLADNLDTIIPLLAIIATGLGVGLVTNAIAARVATDALGKSLLAAFGGPVGIAITAITVAMGLLVSETLALQAATANAEAKLADAQARFESYSSAAREAGVSTDQSGAAADVAGKKFDLLGGVIGRAIGLYKDLTKNARIAAIAVANANISEARSAINKSKQRIVTAQVTPVGQLIRAATGVGGESDINNINKQRALIQAEKANIALLSRLPEGVIKGTSSGGAAASAVDTKTKKARAAKGASGPTAAEIEARFNNDVITLSQRAISAKETYATSAEERAELETKSIDLARVQALESIKAEDKYNQEQKDRLTGLVEIIAFEEKEALAVRTRAQLAQELADLTEAQSRNEIARLQDEYDLATSTAERARIAQQIVETETRAALEAIDRQLIEKDISDAKKKELELVRQGIVAQGERNKRDAINGNLSPIAAELKRLNETNFGDKAEGFGVDALKDLNAGLADAIVNGGNLGDVLEDTGKRFLAQLLELTFQLLVIKPLLESLGGIGGGGGGFLGSLVGGLFGGPRASGGPVSAGKFYRVNETQQEFFRPNASGTVLTMGQLARQNAAGGRPASQQPIELKIYADEGGTFVPRVEALSAGVSVQVVQAASRSLTEQAVKETFRRAQRPGLGR